MAELKWVRSTYSEASANNCVEVALPTPHLVAVRDSKDPGLPHATVTRSAWAAFALAVGGGSLAPSA
ncbi:DUF397 domain-containing protein [Streptomyces kunmingensis]|uniref:DUF397 domain-containing protein n=1 Tax=Streptomyces kunmingensis TaxID=68225 RepID=A0ABU6CQI5_9ACTN|nr:DUF397 domain-containing protein [Streptomyces kunmingensis]MEB3966615.1 DUF397 domain-containing protein [Streptomyces kunmingensis]